jgi:adenylate cyclase
MSAEATFLFADIAGFTALTEAHGDEDAADLAARFFDEVDDLIRETVATRIKTIGDAVLLRVPDPREAVLLGLHVTCDVMGGHGAPGARVGMQHGPAIERAGDWFGSTINVAARVTAEAASGEVLVTDTVRTHAGEIPGVFFHARGKRQLRNVAGPVVLWSAARADQVAEHLAVDPVCRMTVDPSRCAGSLVHDGVEYHFCSLECAARFATDPRIFLGDTPDAA